MPSLLASILLLSIVIPVHATPEDVVRPIQGWDDYRDRLLEDGYSEADADEWIDWALGSLRTMDRDAGTDRIGVPAPPFRFDGWLNAEPMTLEDLRGQVVLVRWWTDTCPFCASSAPALRTLHEQYGPQGLTLIGVFHPKARRDDPLDLPRVRRVIEQRAFEFPIAVDWDWQTGTLKDWWLTGPDRPATSVTFLLDKQGVIRFVHPGMEYHGENGSPGHAMCVDDMTAIRAEVERLLAQRE